MRGRQGERARDLEPAPVRVRERVRGLVPAVAHQPLAEEPELLLREPVDLLLLAPLPGCAQDRAHEAGARVRVRGGHHVLLDRHVEEEPQRLERARDAELRDLVRREADEVAALEQHLALVGPVDTGDQVEQRRLARAVRPDHADDLALVDVQVEVGDHVQAAERLRDSLELEQRRHQTISTRVVPSRPCGRAFINTIRIAPISSRRVTLGSSTSRFSQTNAVR